MAASGAAEAWWQLAASVQGDGPGSCRLMSDAERLHRLALLILNAADDADRVRELAAAMAFVTADAMRAEAGQDANRPIAVRPAPEVIALCGRRIDA